ncbi:MAG: hypothetical protein FWC67_01530 [Defluviitaleaceae bacterium]|nr:hypothetical protein [Defluviitaleaceae bacterium]
MWVENPIRETYEEISKKFNDLCVLVVECEEDGVEFGSGKVIAYHEHLAKLVGATKEYVSKNDLGIFVYDSFSNFDDCHFGTVQVVPYE